MALTMTRLAHDYPDLFSPRAAGDAGRDSGVARAAAHADARVDAWSARAYGYIECFAATRREFAAPEVRGLAYARGLPQPPDGRAGGAPFRRAIKAGVIKRIGSAKFGDAKTHTTDVALWIGVRHG